MYSDVFSSIQRIGGDWRKRYYDDPFHTVVNTSTSRIVIGIFALVSKRAFAVLVQSDSSDLYNIVHTDYFIICLCISLHFPH